MRSLFVALLLALSSPVFAQQTFQFTNAPGAHGVGLRVLEQFDSTRTFGTGSRPIQSVIWYPAEEGGKPLVYDEYLQLIGSVDDFSRTAQEKRRISDALIEGITEGQREPQITLARAQAMWAVAGAKPAPGRYPVAIYAPSFSADSMQNADLCEYLASHGYIVISSPTLGVSKRNTSMNLDGVEAQAADIRFLIDYARTLPNADATQIAVIGYSFGGISSVFAAAKDKRIIALVELDGSARYFNKLVQQAGYVKPESLAVPMLYLAHYPDAIEDLLRYKQDMSGSLINDMKGADLYLFNMNALDHINFSSWFIRSRDLSSFDEYSMAEVSQSYGWMCQYVLQFLNAYEKADAGAKAFLAKRPELNGVPAHMMHAVIRRQL